MRLFIIVFLLLFSFTSFSQERKLKTKKSDYFIEEYSINKENKMKDGEFVKINRLSKDTLIVGNYENDNKVGLWKFYGSKNESYLSFDYDKKIITQLDQTSPVDSFYIKKDSIFYLEKVDNPPIYLGFKREVSSILSETIQLSRDIFEQGLTGIRLASFVIDKTGKLTDIKIEFPNNELFDQNIMKAINMINGDWIPAQVNGIPVDSKICILFSISQSKDTVKFVEKPYLLVINLVYWTTTSINIY